MSTKNPDPVRDTIEKLCHALELARNGLLWYRDTYPEHWDGSDEEAQEAIDEALRDAEEVQFPLAAPEGPAPEPVAWVLNDDLRKFKEKKFSTLTVYRVKQFDDAGFGDPYPQTPLFASAAPEAPPPVEARQPPQSELAKSLAWSNDDGWRAQRLATEFHEIYERLAPSFGYETRPDTKQFDPNSKNGKLMIAVCGNILAALAAPAGAIQRGHLGSTPWGETDDH